MNQGKIGKFITECRKEKNLTQEQLAEKLGTSSKSVSRWENGKTMPDYTIVEDLTKILNISVNEFFYGERISKDKLEVVSEENLRRMFRDKYGNVLRRKFAILSGTMGALISILIYLFFNNAF